MATTPTIGHVFPGAVLHPTQWFGYPTVSAPRRIKATILGVVHTTETLSVPFPSSGKSWTFSVERDGTVHQFMDPVVATPWTNGDKQDWDTSNPLVVAAARDDSHNFNEYCFVTIENVNRIADGQRLTERQIEANRAILQWASKLSGLPLDRKHVIGHYQINGVTRQRCPTVPTDRDRVFGGIVGDSPENTMDLDRIKGIAPLIVSLRDNANIRLVPSLQDEDVASNTGTDKVVVVAVGRVWGPEFPAGSGDRIWLCFIPNEGGLRFFHQSQIANRRRMLDPLTVESVDVEAKVAEATAPLQATIEDQTSRIAGLMTELGEAQLAAADAHNEAEEAKELSADAVALRDALRKIME